MTSHRIWLNQDPDQFSNGSSIGDADDLRQEITSQTSAISNFNEYLQILETAEQFLQEEGEGRHVEDKPRKRRNNSFFACVSRSSQKHLKARKSVKDLIEKHKATFKGVYLFEHAHMYHDTETQDDRDSENQEDIDPKEYFKKLGEDFNEHLKQLGMTDVQVSDVDIFATATYFQRTIYILAPVSDDDGERFFWKFYPPLMETDTRPQWMQDEFITLLQSHTSDENPRFFKIKYIKNPPRATGIVGELEKMLQERHPRTIDIPDGIQRMDFQQAVTSKRHLFLQMTTETWSPIVEKFVNDEEIQQDRVPPELLSHRQITRNEKIIEFLESLDQNEKVLFFQILIKLGLEEELIELISASFPPDTCNELVQECFIQQRTLNTFNSTYQSLFQLMEEIVLECGTTAEQLRERRGKVNIAAMTGSSAGIVGGIMAIVGIALTPVTFGGSLGLTVAGGVIGGLGGITNAGARITELVKQNKDMEGHNGNTRRLATGYTETDQAWQVVSEAFNIGQEGGLTRVAFPGGSNARAAMAVGSILRALKGFYAIPLAALRVAGAAANAAAAILGPISLALDIAFLADAAVNTHKGSTTIASENLLQIRDILRGQNKALAAIVRGERRVAV